MDDLDCLYICKLKIVCIYFPYYNIPGMESFKKEMVIAAGFEPTIFQLRVRNLAASASFFQICKVIILSCVLIYIKPASRHFAKWWTLEVVVF